MSQVALKDDASISNENPSGKKQKLSESHEDVATEQIRQELDQETGTFKTDNSTKRSIENEEPLQTKRNTPSLDHCLSENAEELSDSLEGKEFANDHEEKTTDKFSNDHDEKNIDKFSNDHEEKVANEIESPSKEIQNTTVESKNYVFGSAFKTVSFGSIEKPSIFDETFSSNSAPQNDSTNEPLHPSFTEVSYETGEEEETTLCSAKVKVYLFDAEDKEWKERGIGLAKINQSTENEMKRRIVVWHDVTKKLLINHRLSGNALLTKGKTPRTFQLSVPDDKGKLQIFLLKCNTEEAFNEIWTQLQQIVNK